MGWLKNKTLGSITEIQRREMQDFIRPLENSDSDELASLVVFATERRHLIRETAGWDLLFPALVLASNVTAAAQLSKLIRDFQKSERNVAAASVMVWLFTLRAIDTPELRYLGRAMWRHLERGFPLVPEVAADMEQLTGVPANIDGYNRFPDGLWPDPQ